jgi:hypothetical protein
VRCDVIDVILVLIAGFQVIDYSSVPRELPHPTSTAFGFNAPAWSCPHTPDPGGGSVTDHHRPQSRNDPSACTSTLRW